MSYHMFIFIRSAYSSVCKVEKLHIFQEDQNNYSLVDTQTVFHMPASRKSMPFLTLE